MALVEASPLASPAASSSGTNSKSTGLSPAEILARLHELAFGINPLELPPPAIYQEVATETRIAVEQAANEPRYTPRRPMLLPQLMRAVNDSDVSRRELATLIVQDPALTGNLLKLANSSFYRVSAEPVESIDRAIALLGTEGIRSLIATAVMQPVFRVAGGEFARFPEIAWDHTFRSGTAAAAHAAMVEHDDPFAGQLLALVNGLATIVVFRIALDRYAAHPGLRPNAAVIASLLNAHTAELARDIAASWELSERMLAALEEQMPGTTRESSPLGRSLSTGRLLGALAALHEHASLDGATARAAIAATGSSAAQLEKIWDRLSARSGKS